MTNYLLHYFKQYRYALPHGRFLFTVKFTKYQFVFPLFHFKEQFMPKRHRFLKIFLELRLKTCLIFPK